jgi:hypothetical protein
MAEMLVDQAKNTIDLSYNGILNNEVTNVISNIHQEDDENVNDYDLLINLTGGLEIRRRLLQDAVILCHSPEHNFSHNIHVFQKAIACTHDSILCVYQILEKYGVENPLINYDSGDESD